MKPYFYIALAIFLSIYALLTYYIGIRVFRIITNWVPNVNLKVYWIFLSIIASLYILSRILKDYLPLNIAKTITQIGAYWLAAMFYLVLIFVVVDLFVMALRFFGVVDKSIVQSYPYLNITGVITAIFILGLLTYGTYMARFPKIVEYDITLPRYEGQLEELNAVLISDIHLGKIIDNRRLGKMVDMIYDLEPDIIFIAGDIVDEDIRPFTKEQMYNTFGKLKPKYGMYACLGNHDYIGGNVEQIVSYLEKSGIHVLVDEYIMVEDSFYVAGRNDPTGARISNIPRKDLDSWLVGFDKKLPVILLDHQPKDLQEAMQNGVDLKLSGHTHLGQMFPNRYITRVMYENDYGYSKLEDMQIIVSSGYGTWGPPIRIGTRGEVVRINIKFQ